MPEHPIAHTMTDIVITAAKRTAIGTFNGTLATTPATQLGAHVIKTVMADNGLDGADIDQVILGQVLTAACGQGPARQAAMTAGIPHDKTAFSLNQVCGSGLRAVSLAAQSIQTGESDIVIAGGQENMSLSPHALHLRAGVKFGDAKMTDTMLHDGLWDYFNDYHMGMTAENIAAHHTVSRADQDAYAAESHRKAEAATKAGRFKDEIAAFTIKSKKGDIVFDTDEHIRGGTTVETLQILKPAFKTENGTVTAGNASGLNDGAAAVVVMSAAQAEQRGLKPLARIVSFATVGVEPAMMGTGPIPASRKALEKAGWTISDLDLIESNEAFAAQSCAVARSLAFDMDKVNVNGGAIALGHPIGASGTRCLVTLIHEMIRRDAKKGLVTLCVGGGMGVAMCVARD